MTAMPAGVDAPVTVFVYFRAPRAERSRVPDALARQFALVTRRLGLTGRIGMRHETRGDKPYDTWLEVYEAIPATELPRVLEAIDRASTDSGLALLATEGRHAEVFSLVPPGP